MWYKKKSTRLKAFKAPVPGKNDKFWTKMMYAYYCYRIAILIVGTTIMIKGYTLIENGVTGKVEWIIKICGNESTIKNATPGILLIIVGLIIIILTKDKIGFKR